jgi:hypothetical protein
MKYYFSTETDYNDILSLTREYYLVYDNPIMATITAVKLKHIPLTYIAVNDNIFIIELVDHSVNLLKKQSYLYEFEADTLKQEDWLYFPEHEYELHVPIKISNKLKIPDVYDFVKHDTTIINYETFINFVHNHIPEQKYPYCSPEKYLYHGSPVDIKDQYIKPMNDGHEPIPLVYASCYKSGALKFSVKGASNAIIWNNYNNYTWFLEIHPHLFESLRKRGYLYTVDSRFFKLEKYPVYTSAEKAHIIKKDLIENVYEEMKQQSDAIFITNDQFVEFLLKNVTNRQNGGDTFNVFSLYKNNKSVYFDMKNW